MMVSPEYQIPALPLGGPQVTIVRWLRQPGEPVAAGEPLLVVVNDRAEVALPATAGGILEQTLAAEGAPSVAGAMVATIAAAPAREPALETIADPAPDQSGAAEQPHPRRISPVARKIAAAAGLDITLVASSGVSGRVVK
ncbi:MAG TPA: biotin/lipoyl-containing protein, partial [Roseiflexaceae bacterium]